MDADALAEWTRLEDEYDTEIDRYLTPARAAAPSGGVAPDQPVLERLAALRRRRDAAREKYVGSLDGSPPPATPAAAPDTASIVILGSD
jgi:hypothetical protein